MLLLLLLLLKHTRVKFLTYAIYYHIETFFTKFTHYIESKKSAYDSMIVEVKKTSSLAMVAQAKDNAPAWGLKLSVRAVMEFEA